MPAPGALAAADEQVVVEGAAVLALAIDGDRHRQAGVRLHLAGHGRASARNRFGAMYQPMRVRVLTGAGRVQARGAPFRAFTVKGRQQPALPRTSGVSMHFSG